MEDRSESHLSSFTNTTLNTLPESIDLVIYELFRIWIRYAWLWKIER